MIKEKVVCETFVLSDNFNLYDFEFVLGKDEQGLNIIGLRGKDYEILAGNESEKLKLLESLVVYIEYLLECIGNHNSDVDQFNSRKQREKDE